MISKYSNLMCVKSLITVVMCCTLAALAIMDPADYKTTMENLTYIIITFYFSHQTQKGEDKNGRSNGSL